MLYFNILTCLIIFQAIFLNSYHVLYKYNKIKANKIILSKFSYKSSLISQNINDYSKSKYNYDENFSMTRLFQSKDNKINVKKKQSVSNLTMRWITGLSLGFLGTLWIASGKVIFALIFFIVSITTQNEYFTMVKAVGK